MKYQPDEYIDADWAYIVAAMNAYHRRNLIDVAVQNVLKDPWMKHIALAINLRVQSVTVDLHPYTAKRLLITAVRDEHHRLHMLNVPATK